MGIIVDTKELKGILQFLSSSKKGRLVPDAHVTFMNNQVTFNFGGITSSIVGVGEQNGEVISIVEDFSQKISIAHAQIED